MTEENQYTDEFFINLTMDYDKRDDNIYPLWSRWCALSEDRYYIDGKDGHFYTHIRTDAEIRIEKKRHEIMDMLMTQERPMNEEGHPTEKWIEYENYVNNIIMDNDKITAEPVKSFVDWANEDESQ